jgi:hypothetical protein
MIKITKNVKNKKKTKKQTKKRGFIHEIFYLCMLRGPPPPPPLFQVKVSL